MFNNCQDAMALCKKFGYPDLFLTVTCNPKWDEIQRHLSKSNNYSPYRPDITCRVFHVKLNDMMNDFRKGQFFGRVVASVYTIEFQKRGLPHAHILLWLDEKDKLESPESINSVISAELPDQHKFPKLYDTVCKFMIHGPCGQSIGRFEDIRTVRGHVCDSYREACGELLLLADDPSSMSDPLRVWELKWEILADGILYYKRQVLHKPDLVISQEDLKYMCLVEIDKILRCNGRCLADFDFMPKIDTSDIDPFDNIFITNELSYDCVEMVTKHTEMFRSLNKDQLSAYHQIVESVTNNLGRMFFVDGFGGSGKTYLWSALSFHFRAKDLIIRVKRPNFWEWQV
ncbi:DNA helicase [Trifolium repens]|nr:DNA helicase [Trifolium repens]